MTTQVLQPAFDRGRLVRRGALVAFTLSLAACAIAPPSGPSMLVLPGTGKSFEQFQVDDGACRQFASAQIGGSTAEQAAMDSQVRSAALGTVVGAAAGAAIGGSRGAGVGAGTGLLFGTAAGSGSGASSGYSAQRRYDNGYVQCMYAKGHRVPVTGLYSGTDARPVVRTAPTPPAPAGGDPSSGAARTIPPPPPGNPPPPPPGVQG